MKLIDPDHPFYAPLWRRLLIVGGLVGWTIFELLGGSTTWAVITGVIGAYSFFQLFVVFGSGSGGEG